MNITAPEFIERQARMNNAKCGMSPAMIDTLMKTSDEKLAESIAIAREWPVDDDRAAAMLRAMLIESEIRGLKL